MDVSDFLRQHGDDISVALACRVSVRTVESWRRRERFPRPPALQRLIRMSGGRLTLDGAYSAIALDDA